MNLLNETLEIMGRNGLCEEDVLWVGSRDAGVTWEDFRVLANEDYDNSFGAPEVAVDLMVMFRDGRWLARREYDGCEWWEIRCVPRRPVLFPCCLRKVICDRPYYPTLAEMNGLQQP